MSDPISRDAPYTTAPGDAPDWSQIPHEVLCPLCEYNLRGISEPRCPECGYPFTWEEALDPTRRRHAYVFEQHPERNISSFLSTAFHGLSLRKFWSGLHPTQPSDRPRLVKYWLLCVLACLTMIALVSFPLSGLPEG